MHGVRSVMVPLDLADELIVDASDRFVFSCDLAEIGGDENLAVRALHALGPLPPFRMELRKRIPLQAGLGGGSSNAATVLRAAMSGALGNVPKTDWLQTAHALGSDVPFFLAGTGALVEGTGDRVTPLGAMPRWHALIVKPPVGVSTATAYAQLDRMERSVRPRNTSVSIAVATALQRGDFDAVESLLHNDFQMLIDEDSPIAAALDALRIAGAANPLLAGSGSCTFALAKDAGEVEELDRRLELPSDYARYRARIAATPDWCE
jgi:4-diphosphocytidyl-2-C-methyl-D-erythritol kinase